MAANDKDTKKINRKRSFSFLLISAVLFQAVIIVLYLAFVFLSDNSIFKSSRNKIENNLALYVNSIFESMDNYSERIRNITDTYSFQDFIYESLLDGIDNEELDKISSMFRNTHLPFSSVTIYLVDGQILASIPTTIDKDAKENAFKTAQYATAKTVRATYKESYAGIQFATAITNNQGTTIGFIAANVDKDIFKTSVPGSSVLLLENGVVYFDDTMDLKEISRTTLVSLLNETVIDNINGYKVDNSNYMFYSIGIKRAAGLNVGLLVYTDTILQQYSKYIILAIFSIFFIFLVISFIYDHIKRKKAILESISVHNDKLFDENEFEDDTDNLLPFDFEDDEKIEELERDYEKDNEYIENNEEEENKQSINMDKFSDDIKDIFNDDTKYNYKRNKVYANPKETILSSEEDEYFSSKDSFGFSKNMDFLLEGTADKKDIFDEDIEKSVEDILKGASKYSEEYNESDSYEPDNVPTIPDEYFSGGFKSILEATKGVRFIERDMDYILKWVKDKTGIDVDAVLFLQKENNMYKTISSKNVTDNTKKIFLIEESEAIFSKFLKSQKVIYIDNPKLSKSLSKKFDRSDIEDITAMIFIPIEDREKELKSFFVALSKKGVM